MGLFSSVIPAVVKAATGALPASTTAAQDLQNMPATTTAQPQSTPATVSPDYGTGLPQPYIPGYSPPRPGIEGPPTPSQTAQAWFDEYATGFTPKDTGLQFWTNRINEVGSEAALNEFLNPSWKEGSDQTRHSTMYQDPDYLATKQVKGGPAEYNPNPYNFTPPPKGSIVTQGSENWKNVKTGETATTTTGGWTPPSGDWIRYNPSNDTGTAGYAPVDIPPHVIRRDENGRVYDTYEDQAAPPPQTVPTPTVTSNPTTGTPTYNIGSFTPGAVQSTTPRLNTNIAYNVGPSLSQMYADQLARETGARGLREDEIQAAVRSGYEAIGRGTDMIDPEGAAYWERQLRTGAVSPGDLAATMGQSVMDEVNLPTVRTFETGTDDWNAETPYNPDFIPENFDWQAYVGRSGNADLLQAGIDTEEEARRHYAMHGATEGRKYTPITQEETDQALAALGPATRASYDYYNRMGTWGQSGLPTYGPSPSRASFIRGMGRDEIGETVLTDTLTGRTVLPSGTVGPDGTTASGATMFTTVPMSANDLYSSFFDDSTSFLTGQSNALSPYVTRTTNPQYSEDNAWDMQQRGIPQYNYSMSKDQYDKAVEAGVINPNEYKYDEVGKQILRVAKFAQGGAVNADPTMAFINRQAPAARRAGVTPKQVQKAQDFLAFAQSKRFGL